MNRNLILLFTNIIIICGCATPKMPIWVTTPGQVYDDNLYITAIGTGEDLEQAEKNGLSNLAQRFQLKIESDINMMEEIQETSSSEYNEIEESVKLLKKIDISVDEELNNSKLLETYHNSEGEYYVLVGIDRLESSKKYQEQIIKNSLLINSILNEIKAYDSPLEKLRILNEAYKIAILNQELSKTRSTILKTPEYSSMEIQKSLEIKNDINFILNNNYVKIFDDGVPYDIGNKARKILNQKGININNSVDQTMFDMYIFFEEKDTIHPIQDVYITRWTIDVVIDEKNQNEEVQLFTIKDTASSLTTDQSINKALIQASSKFQSTFKKEINNFLNI